MGPGEELQKRGPLEKGTSTNDFSILALRTPWTVWKEKKDLTQEDETPRLVGAQYATGKEQGNITRRNEEAEPNGNLPGVWMCLVVQVKFNAAKNNIT